MDRSIAAKPHSATSVVLFGAFDRHNFGDLIFPHVAAALLAPRPVRFAGLARRDLRMFGGHAVERLADLIEAGEDPTVLLHVGGEVLTCTAWQAAVMLQSAQGIQGTLAYLASRPAQRAAWVQAQLGLPAHAPYVCSRTDWPALQHVVFCAVGGVALDRQDAGLREEVLMKLRQAERVSVRDRHTLAHLAAAGIAAQLLPDPAVLVAEVGAAAIGRHACQGEVAWVRGRFARGYLAVQCSAEFGDDQTLSTLAAQLDRAARRCGAAVVLFRAGAAPWHDDLAVLQRLAQRLASAEVHVFDSLHLWDICALLAHARAYAGSSLHGRIVATAFGVPRIGLRPMGQTAGPTKTAAFASTWEQPDMPGDVAVGGVADAIDAALCSDAVTRVELARDLAQRFHQGFRALIAPLA